MHGFSQFQDGSCTDHGPESFKEHLGIDGVILDVLLCRMMCDVFTLLFAFAKLLRKASLVAVYCIQ